MKLALKVPPPLQAIIFGFLMWILDKRLPIGQFEFSLALPVAILFAVAGVALVVSSMLAFRKASTTVNPFHPEEATQLVVGGIFGFSRNPMYLSLALLLIGWAIWLGSIYNLVLLLGFIGYITFFQIRPEEEVLKALFGKPYEQYCSRVRRWI
jgi:protein-S-isoprenylcysteine O-methyltransferase Ste14